MSLTLDESWIGTVLEPERAERLEAVRSFIAELTAKHVEAELRIPLVSGDEWRREVVSLSRSLCYLWVFASRRRSSPAVTELAQVRAWWEVGRPALILETPASAIDLEHVTVPLVGSSLFLRRCS